MSHHDSRPDPVDELFARERADLTALGADDLRWQAIARRARVARRARRLRYAGAAAAVALLAAGVTWVGTGGHGGPAPAATQTGHGRATSGPGPSTGPTRLPSPSPTRVTGGTAGYGSPVPAGFTALSISNAGHGMVYVMGVGGCGPAEARCPVLVRSPDDGRTWTTVHTFAGQGLPAAAGRTGLVPADSVVTQVRFANPQVGWVFGGAGFTNPQGGGWVYGGASFATRDGGRTWQQWEHPGETVAALETDGTNVFAVTGSSCTAGTCRDMLTLVGGKVGQQDNRYLGGRPLGSSWADPTISIVGGRPLVAVRTGAVDLVLHPDANLNLVAAPAPAACHGGGPEVIATDASPQHQLVGLCATGGAAGSLGYAVLTSSDGTSWALVSTDALVLVDAGHVSLAAVDRSNLLAVSGGSPDVHGAMMVSHDGGRTWATPVGAPPMPGTGWRWAGAPGGSTYYALAGDGSQYWVSDDRGDHWHPVNIR